MTMNETEAFALHNDNLRKAKKDTDLCFSKGILSLGKKAVSKIKDQVAIYDSFSEENKRRSSGRFKFENHKILWLVALHTSDDLRFYSKQREIEGTCYLYIFILLDGEFPDSFCKNVIV